MATAQQFDPKKVVYVTDKSGKQIPVPKDTNILSKLFLKGIEANEKLAKTPFALPANKALAAATEFPEKMEAAGKIAGGLKFKIAEGLAETPEEKQLRSEQANAAITGSPAPAQAAPVQPQVQQANQPITSDMLAQGDTPSPQNVTVEMFQQGLPVSKGAKEMMDLYAQRANQAAQEGREQVAFYEGAKDEYLKLEQDRLIKQEEGRKYVQEGLNAYQAKAQEIANDIQNLKSPAQYMANVSTNKKLFASLAMAFGDNSAMNNINKIIDDEIKAEQTKLDLKAKGLAINEKFLLEHFKDVAKDDNEAALMAKKSMLEYSQLGLDQMMAKSKSAEAVFNAKRNRAEIQAAIDATNQQLALGRYQAYQAANLTPLTNVKDVPQSEREMFVTDFGKFYSDKESVRKFRAEAGAAYEGLKAVKGMLAVADLPAAERANPLSKIYAKTQINQNAAIGALRIALTGPGVLTEADKEFIKKTIGDPTKIDFLKLEKAKLEALHSLIAQRLTDKAVLYGADPDQKSLFGVNRDPGELLRQVEVN